MYRRVRVFDFDGTLAFIGNMPPEVEAGGPKAYLKQ